MNQAVVYIESISEMNKLLGLETQHPLISVVDFSTIDISIKECLLSTNFYTIMVKDSCNAELQYGRNKYDYQEETMVFFGPRQVVGVENSEDTGDNKDNKGKGIGMFFHPDLLKGTPLASSIKNYHFFSYEVSEALHLSSEERRSIGDCFEKVAKEISHPIDKHSRKIIVSSVDLLLGYCERFYDRQFITRELVNNDLLSKFESILNIYFEDGEAARYGLPTVKYCADRLALSPNYMSDLIKKSTGLSAQEHIQSIIIDRAKTELSASSASVAEIAYSLGFEYPQYFSRQFKKRVGQTPNEYRASLQLYCN